MSLWISEPRFHFSPIKTMLKRGENEDEMAKIEKIGYMNNKRKYNPIHEGNLFGRWRVISKAKPRIVGKNKNSPYWLCECTCGSMIRREISENALQTGSSKSCGCLRSESIGKLRGTYRKQNFQEWCIDNNHQDYLDRWDYDKNKTLPVDVSCVSHDCFYFKCQINKHESSLYQLASVVSMNDLRCKYCNSFAQRFMDVRGEDAIEKYWDFDLNKTDPWLLPGSSKQKVWLKCTDTNYHGSYQISRDSAVKGTGCPYCSHSQIHPTESFGQMLIDRYDEESFVKMWNKDLNKIDPFKIAPSTRKYKVWLNCLDVEYHPPTQAHPNDIKNHNGYCHYCAKIKICKEDSLGCLYPETLDLWSDKNSKTPYDYFPSSNQKVWWKCANQKHKDFMRTISDARVGEFSCPDCSSESTTSKLQNKVSDYLQEKYGYEVLHENQCTLKPRNPETNSRMYYDNEVNDLKLIIEVNGQQHYNVTGFTHLAAKHHCTTPQEEFDKYKRRDEYKRNFALSNGFCYLEIPYWTEKDEKYKELIDNKIDEIMKGVA